MVHRIFWKKRIESLWKEKSVIWLSGVRRAGKTFLSKSLSDIEYFDCELPRIRKMLEDPEGFLEALKQKRIVMDEIHRLSNPSELLKIAADYYPQIKVLATGSSTLGASAKFKDTLTGRKRQLWLTPMNLTDLKDFNNDDMPSRFIHGGLPPFFMAEEPPEKDFQEWVDAYWAKDIQELFRLERRHTFQKFFELLMAQSGGIFEATRFSKLCEVSRTTITNYLKVLEATFVVHIIRPFSTHKPTEIVSAPKVYGFDTGFICYHRGITKLRPEDFGYLWEHIVLNELHAELQTKNIYYWRDKRGHEMDFVLKQKRAAPLAIECKWKMRDEGPQNKNIRAYLKQYPNSKIFIITSDAEKAYYKKLDSAKITVIDPPAFIEMIKSNPLIADYS